MGRLGLVDCLGFDRAMNLEKKPCGTIGRRHCFCIPHPIKMLECCICRDMRDEKYVAYLRKEEMAFDARYGKRKG